MGYFKMSTGDSFKVDPRNPDPSKFRIIKTYQVGDFIVAMVHYPNCTNYEGKKILVFQWMSGVELVTIKFLDPHFTDDSKIIARFVPTPKGWRMAVSFVDSMVSVV